MQYDYCAFQKEQLGDSLNELEQAKTISDRNKRNRAIEEGAKKAIHIEPHLSYLWYDALGGELKNYIRKAWQKHLTVKKIPDDFHFIPDCSALKNLPRLSFMLRVPFTLQKPYLSKDDRAFYLLDNPVRKDKVFQTPMVAATSWKGSLRAALWQSGYKEDNEQIIRLFGNPREDEKGKAGCLYFYPTFFDKIDLEVINPHDRKTGTGKNPILLECVPSEAIGELVILYVPFGNVQENQVAEDLKLVAKGIQDMLTVYGFGAKTSSGFGVAEINSTGEIGIRADLPGLRKSEPKVTAPEPELPRYLIAPGQLHPDFLNPDGSFKSEVEYMQGRSGKKAKQLYNKAQKWWEGEERRLAEAATQESVAEPESPPPELPMTKESFASWSELRDRVHEIAQQLHQSEEIGYDS